MLIAKEKFVLRCDRCGKHMGVIDGYYQGDVYCDICENELEESNDNT